MRVSERELQNPQSLPEESTAGRNSYDVLRRESWSLQLFFVLSMTTKMQKSVLLPALALLVAVCAITASTKADNRTHAVELPPCACASAESWQYWRMVGEEVRDSGSWQIGSPGLAQTTIRSVDGHNIVLLAAKFPLPEGKSIPDVLVEEKHYFAAMNPVEGMLIAEQHRPDEYWIYQIGSRVLVSKTPFQPVSSIVQVRRVDVEGNEASWEITAQHGFWFYVTCENEVGAEEDSYALGVMTAGFSELSDHFLEQSGAFISDEESGLRFAVTSQNPRQRWFVTFLGHEYEVKDNCSSLRTLAEQEWSNFALKEAGVDSPNEPAGN